MLRGVPCSARVTVTVAVPKICHSLTSLHPPPAALGSIPPGAPFLSAAKEMGERTPPKTHGFWISFRRLPVRSDSSEMLNRRISLRAAAFTLKCRRMPFYILHV